MDIKKKKTILTIIAVILLIVVIFLAYLVIRRYTLKASFEKQVLDFAEKNENTVFSINKITLFSSADAKNKTSYSRALRLENLYQYTDIAFYIESSNEEKNAENTFKNVSISNIKFNKMPTVGEPHLYFKSINNFAQSKYPEDTNLINDNLEFNVTSEDTADLNTPTLYNNLANPITLSYVNSNVKTDYTITDTSSPITYDGSLLQKCDVSIDDLACNLSFDINITNNKDEEFKTTVYIDIPLTNDNQSIYNGSLKIEKDANFIFYRYK